MPSAQLPEFYGVQRVVGPNGGGIPMVAGLSIPEHDFIGMTYTSGNLTGVVYKDGGSGGTTVATLTLAYDVNDNLTSVTKS